MRLTFHGGVERVTGSNFRLETTAGTFLIDCGLIQSEHACEQENFAPFAYDPASISAVLVTHAHLDHVGRLPKLVRDGFRGPIISTPETKVIAQLVLEDGFKVIHEHCFATKQEDLYAPEDIVRALSQWQTVNYGEPWVHGQLRATFFDAGHILGSAFIRLEQLEIGASVIFSGDLGNSPNPILPDTAPLPPSDYLVLESTYGDRNHEHRDERVKQLGDAIKATIQKRGVLIIPVFAIERTQELLFDIGELMAESTVPLLPIFIDSPLALRVTEVYKTHLERLNPTAQALIQRDELFNCPNVHNVYSRDDEERLLRTPNPKIILAGSGMVTGGRILNLLKRYVGEPTTTVLFVGYQAGGSLGRTILEGERAIRIERELFTVKAKVERLLSYSDHKDQQHLLEWVKPRRTTLKKIFLSHGDPSAKETLSEKLQALGPAVIIPKLNQSFEL